MSEKTDSIFIRHILDSIKDIEDFSKGLTKEELLSSRLRQSAIIREIEVIGEAAKNISENIKNKDKEIPWKAIIGARDKMIHHYFGIDFEVVWKIIKEDIQILKKQILEIMKKK